MPEEELDPTTAAGGPLGPPERLPVAPLVTYPPTRPRRRAVLLLRFGVGLAALLGLLGGPVVMLLDRDWWQPLARTALVMKPQPGSAREGGVDGATRYSAPAPATADGSAIRAHLQAILDAQAAALLRGDERAFLAPVDPGESALADDLRRRFVTLRAMSVMGWTETLGDEPQLVDGSWRATVRIGYCFVVPGCRPVTVPVVTRWTNSAGRSRLVEFGSSGASDLGPRPWEVSDLRVVIGSRVVVAASRAYASRLPALLAAAEEAALVTDRYARWAPPPGRYLVYVAGPEEWGHWYGVRQAHWVAGYALPITSWDTEIVLNGQRVSGDGVVDTLRHEFTHVVTLADVQSDYSRRWWLVEGIAEYVRMVGRPLSEYELLTASRGYVAAGNPTDIAALTEPNPTDSTEDASGRYGVAFLSVRWLAERFGEDRMLDFFDQVVRQGAALPQAAADVFGVQWETVTGDCAEYVRNNLR